MCRIALNSWIDRERKRKRSADFLSVEQAESLPEASFDPIELRCAMEVLIAHLPVRQRVFLLLVDIFGYTALETAQLVQSTEGAVKAGLHRARAKLKSLGLSPEDGVNGISAAPAGLKVDERVVYTYLQAFSRHNPYALARLLNEEAEAYGAAEIGGSVRANRPDSASRRLRAYSALSPQGLRMAA